MKKPKKPVDDVAQVATNVIEVEAWRARRLEMTSRRLAVRAALGDAPATVDPILGRVPQLLREVAGALEDLVDDRGRNS